jgi:hypothetical protein
MDAVSTVGHDLSCVTDVICMEPTPQQDAWDQLISRAYRMGADIDATITVRTLAYAGGAELSELSDGVPQLSPRHPSGVLTELGVLERCPWADGVIPSARQAARQLFSEDEAPQTPGGSGARKRPRPARARSPEPVRSVDYV